MKISASRDNVVKSGAFLYDDSVLCDICVVVSPIRFGTGDYEDHFEVREDVKVDLTICSLVLQLKEGCTALEEVDFHHLTMR